METMKVKGYGATVTFDGETITIDRTKFGKSIVGIEQTVIPMSSVVDVSLGKATLFINGLFCIAVLRPNGEVSRIYTKSSQAQFAPYSVIYNKSESKDFESLYEAVRACIPVNAIPIEHDQTDETSFAKQQAKWDEREAKLQEKMQKQEEEFLRKHPEGRELKIFKGDDGTVIILNEHQIWCGREKHTLQGVSASLEDGSALESRVTVTRLLLAGPFAFAFKKKKGGEKYVTIEGPDFAWIAEAGRKRIKEAVTFVNTVNNQVRKDTAETVVSVAPPASQEVVQSSVAAVPAPSSEGGNIADELAKLAQLHDAGILSDDEFNAAKKKTLGL